MSTSNIKAAMHNTAETVKDDARDAMASASELGATLRDEAAAKVKQGADAAAEQGQKIAENIRDFASRQNATGARILDSVATSVSDLADSVNAGPIGALIADSKAVVQRNPMAFLVGAAIVGFAAGRLAMAARSDRK